MDVLRRARHSLWIAASLGGALLVWEAAVRLLSVPEYILPAPSRVLVALYRNAHIVAPAALYTLQPMLAGFVMAAVLGVAMALLVVYSKAFEAVFYPLLVVLQIIPKIAIAPLFIIWVGFGLPSKILLVFLLSFFPIVVNAIAAFKAIESDVFDLARTYRASRLRIFWQVELPGALPSLFAGFKVAAALSATAAVVAEFVASDNGLGYLLLGYNGNMNTSMTFAVIIVLSVLGLALYGAVEAIERLAIPWHVSQRRDDLSGGRAPHLNSKAAIIKKPKREPIMPITRKAVAAALLALSMGAASALPAAAADKASLRLNFLLSGVHTIFYLGKSTGAYSAEGIDLDIGEGQGSVRTVQTVANGGDTFGLADGGSVIAGATRGAPVVSIMGILNKSPYAISFRADSGVSTIKDVEGKLIAVSAGEASLALLPPLWQHNGVDGSKVRTLNVDGAGKIVAILQKRVDGILAGLENQVVVLSQKGLEQKVFSFADLGLNTEGLTILVTKSTLADKPDLAARFVRATRKAIEAARQNPDAAVAAALAEKPQGDKDLLKAQLLASLALLESPDAKGKPLGYMAPQDWVRTLDLMKQYQDATTDLQATAFYTNQFVEK